MHKSITKDRILSLYEESRMSLDDPGLCLACGCEAYGVEPDARRYECEACGESKVYGVEELLMRAM